MNLSVVGRKGKYFTWDKSIIRASGSNVFNKTNTEIHLFSFGFAASEMFIDQLVELIWLFFAFFYDCYLIVLQFKI